ncbi:hypothetical protein HGRIS_009694 [Hohenbuehelia grisea]|uniref:AB hydrolase-1 domain-containing protein n=1 Tax=Hohenbuehelia grisea TaxID=104357 RepID=A0ABR3J2E9_9AGAR
MSQSLNSEKLLPLDGGRTLAYAENGNGSSSLLVIFLHGMFGVGTATEVNPVLAAKDVHFIAPTLPAWGNSSPIPSPIPYHVGLAADIAALIRHLHPEDENLRIYIAGGSYGTVPAQMLYGAPYDIFPYGPKIAGLLLGAPLTPFRYHKEHASFMTMTNYIAIGAPSQAIPFRLLARLAKLVLGPKLKTPEKAEQFIRETLFDRMDEAEREEFRKWRGIKGKTEGQFEKEMGLNSFRSVAKTWDGFLEVADVLNSDWGFEPAKLDDDHVNSKPVLVVVSKGDTMAPPGMGRWLANNYRNSTLKVLDGGHLALLYHFDETWAELLAHEG